MHDISPTMRACADRCLSCYAACISTAMNHCLELGGEHVGKEHFTLMMACAEMCRTAAHFLLVGSPHHRHTCADCARLCEECAEDCERLGDMDACGDACRRCAESCGEMAG